MASRTRRSIAASVMSIGAIVPNGCDEPRNTAGPVEPAPAPRVERWVERNGSLQLAVRPADEPELAAALQRATARAQATLEDARTRWTNVNEAERSRWAIKWAAPLRGGGVEHVWVEPLHWSPFRIEGVLASPPQGALESGRDMGELVSFPAEEVSDWVRFTTDDRTGPREGGFTIEALEQFHEPLREEPSHAP